MLLAWGLGFGALAAATSRQRARRPLLWFGYGAILGPIATLILRSAPPGHCPTCLEPSRGWLFVCGRCRSDLRPATVSAAAPATQPALSLDGRPPSVGAIDAKGGAVAAGAAPDAQTRPGTDDGVLIAGQPAAALRGVAVRGTDPEAAMLVEQAGAAGLVASGVYVGGMAPLVLGSRYSLVVRSETLEVLGPVESAPERVVVSRSLGTIDATVIGGRLLVTGVGSERARFALAFERLSGVADELLEAALTRGTARDGTGGRS